MIVVKVGGSLYDLPDLADRLRDFLSNRGDPDWLLVPGGGTTAATIRAFDRVHSLGPEKAHWLALRACSLNAHFFHLLFPDCPLVTDPARHRGAGILDPFAFGRADDGQPGCIPHAWEATSDSVAARAAVLAGGDLVLLKSAEISPHLTWEEAARAGLVDPVFPGIVRAGNLRAEAINLRAGERTGVREGSAS